MVQIGSRANENVLFVEAVLSYQATKPRVGPDDLILPMDHETIKAFEERISSEKPHVPFCFADFHWGSAEHRCCWAP